MKVPIHVLPHGLGLPGYATAAAAGLDLAAAIAEDAPVTLDPWSRLMVPTGLAFALPPGTEAQVRPRSGLAAKHGVTVLNTPGTIDADYRGEVQVILVNLSHLPFAITRGMRIAQLVLSPVLRVQLAPIDTLDATPRGGGGFGSTGV